MGFFFFCIHLITIFVIRYFKILIRENFPLHYIRLRLINGRPCAENFINRSINLKTQNMKTLLRTFPLLVVFSVFAVVANAQLYNTTQTNCTNVSGGTINFNFTNLGTPAGDGTLTLQYHGDLDLSTETFDLLDENNNVIAAGLTTTAQCSGQGTSTFTIPVGDLIAWSANGSIDFSAEGSTAVSANICNCTFGGSGASASFSVTMTLEYPEVTGPDDIGLTAILSPTLPSCNTNPAVEVEITNTGTNTVNGFDVNWTLDGVAQTPVNSTAFLDTLNGSGASSTTVNLGNINVTGNNEIIVWTSNPNGTNDSNPVNDTASILVNSGLNGLYTVGTPTSDYPTVADAENALLSFGLCGPTTLEFPNGNFTGTFDLSNLNTTTTNTLTIQGQGAANSTLASNDDFVIGLDGMKHITIKNLYIENTNSADDHHGVFITNQSDSITIDSCTIEVANSTLNLQPVFAGNSPTNQFGDGENVSNLTISNSELRGGDAGLNIQGDDANGVNSHSQNLVLTNTRITNFTTYGIYLQWALNPTIENCVIDSATNSLGDGMFLLDIQEFNISGNEIKEMPDYGIYISDGNSNFTPASRGLISNNMITAGDEGMYFFDLHETDIFHNSVLAVDDAAYGNDLQSVDVRNNIFVSSDGYSVYYADSSPFGTIDYNIYHHTTTTDYIYFGGTVLSSLQDIVNLDPTQNQNALVGDPTFVSNTDLHVTGVLASNVGDNSVGITVDIDGDTRPDPTSTIVDIGADEFIVPADDASMSAFNSPGFPYCSGDSAVVVSFTNVGTDTLTSVDLNFSVNGGAVSTVNWTGVLNPAEDTTNVFIANNLAGAFNDLDTLVAWTSNPNGVPDINTSFDTITYVIRTGLNGTYTIDPASATADYASFTEAANDLAQRGVCGPTTFEAVPGTYTERLTLEEYVGASATNTVTFTSTTGDSTDVILTEAATAFGENYVVLLSGGDYFRFANMTIEHSAASSYGRVFEYEGGASHNVIEHCEIVGNSGNSTSFNYALIYSNPDLDNYNTFRNNVFRNGSYGIYWFANSTTELEKGTLIEGNDFIDQYWYGMTINEQDSLVIRNNYITSTSSYTGISYGIDVDDSRNYILIENNHIVSDINSEFPTYGIHLEDNEASFTEPMLVINNRVLVSDPGASVYAIDVDDQLFARVENNTAIVAQGGSFSRAGYFQSSSSGVELYNNIFANYGDGYALYELSGAIQNSDHNVLYSAVGEVAYSSGALFNLAAWQSTTGFDANSMELDPTFSDSIEMTLCLDTLDGAALNTGNVMADFENDMRGASYDIGADEFTAINNFTLGDDFVLCDANDTVFSVSTFDTVVWNQVDTTANYTIQGAGSFRVDVFSACGTATDTVLVIGQEASSLPSLQNICADETAQITTGITAPVSVMWSTGEISDSIAVSAAGQINVEVVDTVGCVTMDSITITQSPAVDIPDSLDLCEGTIDFLNPGISGNYQWQDGSTGSTITVNQDGTYSVTVTDQFSCVSSDTTEVIEIPQPDASFTSNTSFITAEFFSTNQNGVTYTWDFGDGTTGTGANAYHIYDWQGIFTVTLTASNQCDTVTIEQEVEVKVTTSVEEASAAQNVNVFPNPNNGNFNVALELSNDSEVIIELFDLQGRLLKMEQLGRVNGTIQHNMNVTELAQGIYILKTTIGDEASTHRISIQ